MLSHLSDYLRQHGRASLADLALALDSTPTALEGMLAILERKGRVRRLASSPGCGTTCCQCDAAPVAVYEWCGARADA